MHETGNGNFRMNSTIRSTLLPFYRLDVSADEMLQVRQVLDSGCITTGTKTRQLEELFARYVGAKHAVAVNSSTAAIHLALEAISLKRGEEVITTPFANPGSVEAIRYFDAHPVFIDVDATTLNMRPELVAQAVTERTKVILLPHVAGLSADIDRIWEVAHQHGLRVINDVTFAFPASFSGQMMGSLSDFTCFGFYSTEGIATSQGAVICTDNAAWAEWCRIMAAHGIRQYESSPNVDEDYEIIAAGFDYALGDLASGIGLAQLNKAEQMWLRRKEIAAMYNRAFSGDPALQGPSEESGRQHGWHQYILRLNLEALRIGKAEFVKQLRVNNISCSVQLGPLHIHPYYKIEYGYEAMDFPVAYSQYRRLVCLPIYSKMSNEDVHDVAMSILDIVGQYRATASQLVKPEP